MLENDIDIYTNKKRFQQKLKCIFLLQKCLTTLDLTSLGVGSCVGTGMYLVAGMVAKNYAGPGVVVSFIIAAVASIFSGKINNCSFFIN